MDDRLIELVESPYTEPEVHHPSSISFQIVNGSSAKAFKSVPFLSCHNNDDGKDATADDDIHLPH